MKRFLGLALVAALAACDGDDDDDGGGGSGVVLSGGTIGGNLVGSGALSVSGTCSEAGVTVTGAVAVLSFATVADVCGALQQGRDAPNASSVFIAVTRFNATGQAVTLTPGTYPVGTIPTPDAQGNFAGATVLAVRNGATLDTGDPTGGCVEAASSAATSGSVTVTSVSASAIAGTISATLDDGGTVTGSFNAPLCGGAYTLAPTCSDLVAGLPSTVTCQ